MSRSSRVREEAEGPREHWSVRADAADVAVLDIPADLRRERRFEIDCRFVVRTREDVAPGAWHAMRVSVDGAQEWSRRIDTANPGASDSLDVHFRRDLPAGRPLRIVATTEVGGGAQRVSLAIEADEGG